MSRYRFVEAEKDRYPVTQLCRMAQVSRAAYYQWHEGRGSERQVADATLTAAVRAIHTVSRGQYGVPRTCSPSCGRRATTSGARASHAAPPGPKYLAGWQRAGVASSARPASRSDL